MKNIRILALFVLVLFGATTAQAQSAKPTIILVHGIWADGSSWTDQIRALQAKGYKVISVQNGLTSLADDVAATKRAIQLAEGNVVLVGHSWGGFVITQAGNEPKVKGLVYVAAFAPDAGENVPALSAHGAPAEIGQYFVSSGGFVFLSEDGVQKAFAQDLSVAQQHLIYATQLPAQQTLFGEKSGAPAWKQKPNWFIITQNDKALSPDVQRFMAKRSHAVITEIASGHVVMQSHPEEVLQVIEAAANHVK
ncbi:alpha/beta hydrolase [Chitinophaga arvensicola]|uniref:Pimeloyl-ACP methyl ester carboxylesterase n=1 Tax=Chitinophaga arvensicola TaxID=29529 RepID=A0A1I0R8K3_9BACT|nr:alpha/beta hydrolase [Chitinophaga arvensicola]SEW37099.1 Pimeloyl-ACP methyl ester carboxylesterase [Chitinophaga arvensicola]